jgi:hypothetical protein
MTSYASFATDGAENDPRMTRRRRRAVVKPVDIEVYCLLLASAPSHDLLCEMQCTAHKQKA